MKREINWAVVKVCIATAGAMVNRLIVYLENNVQCFAESLDTKTSKYLRCLFYDFCVLLSQ